MKLSVVKIILIKQDCKDDIINITPSETDNTYNIEVTQNTINNVVYSNILQRKLPQYLDNLLTSVRRDEEGPQDVQFDVPSYPTVIIRAKDVVTYLPVLLDQIASIEDNWPSEQTVTASKKPASNSRFTVTYNGRPFANRPTHTFYDDDAEYVE